MEYVIVTGRIETDGGEFLEVHELGWAEEVDDAVARGLEIYTVDARGDVDVLAFDGERWLVDERPELPSRDESYNVPTTPYVDQRVDLLQAEVEALTEALLEVDPENAVALAVRSRTPDARIAMAFDKEADMDEVIGALRGVPAKEAQ